MKHYSFLLFTLCFLVMTAHAGQPQLSKTTKREYQKVLKQLAQEGWSVWGKSQSLDKALMNHFLSIEQQGITSTTFESRGKAASANAAYRKAMHNAAVQYAQQKGSRVQGSAETHISSKTTGEETASQTDINASYHSSTDQNVDALKPSLSLTRESNGEEEILLLFVVQQ